MISALTILQQVGIEPILHYCCRDPEPDRDAVRPAGGICREARQLPHHHRGPPELGEYPDVTGVFDVDAIGLVQVAANLNRGLDIGGNPIDPPTGLFIGVGANPCAVDLEREIERYYRKIDAGRNSPSRSRSSIRGAAAVPRPR